MKKTLLLLVLLISATAFCQVPQGISYQAIATNGSGNPIVNSNVGVRLSVLDNSASGPVLYTETHVKMTNAQGLFNTVIGQGTPTTGTFSSINWGTNSKFLKVEMDVAGGTNYALIGNTQLLSVPYAMYAGNTASVAGNSSINDDIVENSTSNFAIHNPNEFKVYVFNTTSSSWSSQSYVSGFASIAMYQSIGNFLFNNPNESKVYIYNARTNSWGSQVYTSGFAAVSITGYNGNFRIHNPNENKLYVFNAKTGAWSSQTYTPGMASPVITESVGNILLHNPNDQKLYVYNGKTGVWAMQAYVGGMASPAITASNGNFLVHNPNETKYYIYNAKSGSWSSQTYVGGMASPAVTVSEGN